MYSLRQHIVPGNFIVHYCALGQNKARTSKASSLTCTEKLRQSSLGPRLASFLVLCVFFSWSRRSLPLFSLYPNTVSMHFYVLPRVIADNFAVFFFVSSVVSPGSRAAFAIAECSRRKHSSVFLLWFLYVSHWITSSSCLVM